MAVRRRQERRATAAQWTSVNPVLAAAEIGVQIEVDGSVEQFKIGDGTKAWTALDFIGASGTVPDTGWRYLGDLMSDVGEGYNLHAWVHRVGYQVTAVMMSTKLPDDYGGVAYLPAGFKPSFPDVSDLPGPLAISQMQFMAVAMNDDDARCLIRQVVDRNGDIGNWYPADGNYQPPWKIDAGTAHSITFTTADAWPSVLPGTAADPQ